MQFGINAFLTDLWIRWYFLAGSFFWVILLCLIVVKPKTINFFIYVSFFDGGPLGVLSRKSWHQFGKELLSCNHLHSICIPIDFVEMTLQQPWEDLIGYSNREWPERITRFTKSGALMKWLLPYRQIILGRLSVLL